MGYLEDAFLLKEQLDSLRPLKIEDEQRIMQKFRLDWNFHSNNLEGNRLSYGETKALLLFGITAQGKPLRDHFEITGHNEAIEWIIDIVHQNRPLNETFICQLHKLILKESYEVNAITPDGKPTTKKVNVGMYKKTPNHVLTQTGEIFRFATPEETPAQMNDLINWYRTKLENDTFNPILLASEFHYKFIRIHPFDDGNGRTARILMNFVLMQNGYPPVIIKTEDKENYLAVLRQADTGQIQPFIDYISQNLIHSLNIMIKGANGKEIEEPDDLGKEILLLEKRLEAISNPISVTKSKKVLEEVLKGNLKTLFDKFDEECSRFKKFYLKTCVSIAIDHQPEKSKKKLEFSNILAQITDQTTTISLTYLFDTMRYFEFKRNGFHSTMTLFFADGYYQISTGHNNDNVLEKPYNIPLTDKEINTIVISESKKHTQFIDRLIEEKSKE